MVGRKLVTKRTGIRLTGQALAGSFFHCLHQLRLPHWWLLHYHGVAPANERGVCDGIGASVVTNPKDGVIPRLSKERRRQWQRGRIESLRNVGVDLEQEEMRRFRRKSRRATSWSNTEELHVQ